MEQEKTYNYLTDTESLKTYSSPDFEILDFERDTEGKNPGTSEASFEAVS